jgi:hypothetical protein
MLDPPQRSLTGQVIVWFPRPRTNARRRRRNETLADGDSDGRQAGFDYNFAGHWFANFDVKEIFLNTSARIGVGAVNIKAKDSLNPLLIGAGVGYRF